MLAHAGGAATLDAPPWLLAYGATALVLLVTVTLRGRVVVAAAGAEPNGGGANASTLTSADTDGDGDADASASQEPDAAAEPRPGGWRADGRVVGRVAGVVTLGTVAAAAFVGPDASASNLAPSAVLAVWWVGLPLACVVVGDVMLVDGQFTLALVSDPFGRGWDLFGTALRTVDYSPLSVGAIGAVQLVAAVGGATWGVVIAVRTVQPVGRSAPEARTALRVLWVVGVTLAVATAVAVAVLSADLE